MWGDSGLGEIRDLERFGHREFEYGDLPATINFSLIYYTL